MSAWEPSRDESGFYSVRGPRGTSIWIESDRIDECMSYYNGSGLAGIAISPYMGYKLDNLDFLRRYPTIKVINVSSEGMINTDGLYFLRDLECLLLGDTNQSVDVGSFPKLEELYAEWSPKLILPASGAALRIMSLHKYRSKSGDLSGLPWLPKLEDLSIIQSTIVSLNGVERYESLDRLELSYCTKLIDISVLSGMKTSGLKVLEFEACRKISNHDAVSPLPKLKVLRFNSCSAIPSINFIKSMHMLEEFRFVGTKVIDGRLDPLVNLKSVGFNRSKHYSHTPDEVNRIIGS